MVCFRNIVMLFILLLAGLDVCAQVRADFRYSGGVIEADSASISVVDNRHRMLTNFIAHTIGKDIRISDYRDSFCVLNDSVSGQVSIDMVCFQTQDEALDDWLEGLAEKDYIAPNIPSEAPERCLFFRRADTLIIVWCNLFADPNEIVRLTEEYLQSRDINNIPMASEPQKRIESR